MVQAGSSEAGRDFAARHGETIFTTHSNKESAKAFYSDQKHRVAAAGRNIDQAVILPDFSPMTASTETEAKRLERELNELADPEVGRMKLSDRFDGEDLTQSSA